MEEREYIESLENLLIFMCQTYEETQQSLRELYKEEKNEALFKIPTIQGTGNSIGIMRLAQTEFIHPKHGFVEIEKELKNRRNL